MKKTKTPRIDKNALKAMREAVHKVVEERKKSGISLSIWKDGKLVIIPAAKITAAMLKQ